MHPTQLYEMVAAVLLGGAALVLARRKPPAGVPFLAFAAGFTAFRLANGFLRVRQDVITAPAWFYPMAYSVAILVLGGLAVQRYAAVRRSSAS